MRPWRNVPCVFCGLPLTARDYAGQTVITKPRTSWRLHTDCDKTIKRLKTKKEVIKKKPLSYLVANDLIRKNLDYIYLNAKSTVENTYVYT
jgi:hypothetical protein